MSRSWRLGMTYESSNANLRTSVTKLRECSVEQAVLLPERLYIGICVGFRGLECHICIGDLWDRRAGAYVSVQWRGGQRVVDH